ncbi:hypothetical protein V8E55_010120 [Tylopilus felleus]
MLELSLFRIADSHGLSRTEHLAVMRKDLLSHLLLSCDDGGIGFECRNMCERKNDNWLRETCDALGCGQCRRTTHETESTRKSYSHLPLMVPHSIYTVHATMPTHETFFLDGYEDSAARHNMKWVRVKDKILKTIGAVGAHKWAGICSDSIAVTKNARRDIVDSIPTILNLNDVCHHIHNTIKNITELSEFERVCNAK